MARSPEERFLMAIGMFDAVRAMVLASLPTGLSDDEVPRRLFGRLYADVPRDRAPAELFGPSESI